MCLDLATGHQRIMSNMQCATMGLSNHKDKGKRRGIKMEIMFTKHDGRHSRKRQRKNNICETDSNKNMKSTHSNKNLLSAKSMMFTTIFYSMYQVGAQTFTGPSICQSDGITIGYTDLPILREDIIFQSESTGGTNGGTFTLCPLTTFDFSDVPIPGNDDGTDDDPLTVRIDDFIEPIVITADNTKLRCGPDGSSTNDCILVDGDFHLGFLPFEPGSTGPIGIEIVGLTFVGARNSSVMISDGNSSSITFRDCHWKENNGDTAFSASAPEPDAPPSSNPTITSGPTQTGTPTISPAPFASPKPTLSAFPTLTYTPTSTPIPTITAFPTVTEFPTNTGGPDLPSSSPEPSSTEGPSVIPTISVKPTSTAMPSSNIITDAPTITNQPSSSSNPSSQPSITDSPSSSVSPTNTQNPSVSLSPSDHPSLSSVPSLTANPTGGDTSAPTITNQPSLSAIPSSQPTVTGNPSASLPPTKTQNPSVSIFPSNQPTISASPSITAEPTGGSSEPTITSPPSLSSLPSTQPTITGNPSSSLPPTDTQGPSLSLLPSSQPSLSSVPSATTEPSGGTTSVPSITGKPSLSVVPSAQPTITGNPSASIAPTDTQSPSQSLVPSDQPSLSLIPSITAEPSGGTTSAPTITSRPSLSALPSATPTITGNPSLSAIPSDTQSPSVSFSPSNMASISSAPSITAEPSGGTTSAPTITSQPSLSVLPSATPTITGNPSLSAVPSDTQSPSVSFSPSNMASISSAPSITAEPSSGTTSAPTITGRPSLSSNPSFQPSITVNPTTSTSPSGTQGPSVSLSPSAQPSLSSIPTVTAKPSGGTTSVPTTTHQPTLSIIPSSQPTIAGPPSSSAPPSESYSPSVSSPPSHVPSTSSNPTISVAPSSNPSTTQLPTTSSAPSSSHSPSVSGSPSVFPTLSTQPSSSQLPSFNPSTSVAPTSSLNPSNVPSIANLGFAPITRAPIPVPIPAPITRAPVSPGSNLLKTVERAANDDATSALPESTDKAIFHLFDDDTVDTTIFPDQGSRRTNVVDNGGFILTMEDCTFFNNSNFRGNLISLNGELSLLRTKFTKNSAAGAAGNLISINSDLNVSDSDFYENNAQGSTIAVFQGNFSISDSNLVKNTFDQLPAPVVLDPNSALLLNDNNCGSNLPSLNQDCEGIFVQDGECLTPPVCEGECFLFSSLSCVNITCYSDWTSLSNAIDSNQGGTFTLCPNSVLNVDGLNPIVLRDDGITIRCGETGRRENSCAVFGGAIQFEIEGSPTGLSFSGITFLASTSVSVSAFGSSSASASFDDCEWAAHIGFGAVVVYNGAFNPEETMDGTYLELLPGEPAMAVGFYNCSFSDNVGNFATIANFGGNITIDASVFFGSKGQGGAISNFYSASMALSNSCFTNNVATELPGMIFLDAASNLDRNVNNFGADNSVQNGTCTQIFREVLLSAGRCVPLEAEECAVFPLPPSSPSQVPSAAPTSDGVPSAAPSNRPTPEGCYDSWDRLSNDVAVAGLLGNNGTFVLCPGSVLNVDLFPDTKITPIIIASNNIIIQCGDDGSAQNNCAIFGGIAQFELRNSVTGVKFLGLNLLGSSGTSIIARGSSDADAEFINCTWAGHIGHSAVLLYGGAEDIPDGDDADFNDIISLPPPAQPSMTLNFLDCSFTDNVVQYASVLNLGGTVDFQRSLFFGNFAEGGVVSSLFDGRVSFATACFFTNTNTETNGTIFLAKSSTLLLNDDTFGANNIVENADCKDIFLEEGSSCLQPLICDSTCIAFESTTCSLVPSLPTEIPSFSPSTRPSDLLPSAEPSTRPSDLIPSTSPSQIPSNLATSQIPSKQATSQNPSQSYQPSGTPSPTLFPTTSLEPTISERPSVPGTFCYDDWTTLSYDVRLASAFGKNETFLLCTETTIEVNGSAIEIFSGNITLQCGQDGSRENRCIISGGTDQFVLKSDVSHVKFIGLTMEGSTGISVNAGANSDSLATFVDCAWMRHTGKSALQVKHIDPECDHSMSVRVQNCIFTENSMTEAVILNSAGNLDVDKTLFLDNIAQGGAVSVLGDGELSFTSNCFVNNTAELLVGLAGAILVEESTTIEKNEDNFGLNNGDCNGIYIFLERNSGSTDHSESLLLCEDSCVPFEATSCAIATFPTHSPAVTPSPTTVTKPPYCLPPGTMVPSSSSSAVPSTTVSPSQIQSPTATTPSPSSSPSIRLRLPTQFPSNIPSMLFTANPSRIDETEEPTTDIFPTVSMSYSFSISYDYLFAFK